MNWYKEGVKLLPSVSILGHTVSSYMLFNFILAPLSSTICGLVLFKRRGYKLLSALGILLFALFATYLGGRISHYIIYYEQYKMLQLSIFSPKSTGIILITGVIFAMLCIWVLAKVLKKNYFEWMDILCIDTCFAIFFAKIGCFLVGCCEGIHTSLPWGVVFNNSGVDVHPTQIYESLFGIILGIILLRIYFNSGYKREGDIFKIFGFGYVFFRFIMYYLRATPVGAQDSVLAPVGLLLISIGFLIYYLEGILNPEVIGVQRHVGKKKLKRK